MRERWELTRPVFLVGFMGAGKTSAARRLARSCGISSIDMDTYLERREGRTVKEIFADGGEEAFRAIEADVLRELGAKEDPSVVSCGGGVVERAENRRLLQEAGFVVHLAVSADEAAARISNRDSRPLFNDIESARRLCERRQPLYEEAAHRSIATGGKAVGQIARELRELLEEEGVLCRRPE